MKKSCDFILFVLKRMRLLIGFGSENIGTRLIEYIS